MNSSIINTSNPSGNGHRQTRTAVLLCSLLLGLTVGPVQAQANSASTSTATSANSLHYQIIASDLEDALKAYSEVSGQTIVVEVTSLNGKTTRGISGTYTSDTALRLLLAGSGLEAQQNASGQWVVKSAHSHTSTAPAAESVATLPEVTVTGSSLETDLQVYPGSVSIITEDSLKTSTTVIEALASVPGVSTGDDFGRTTGQQFHIRGFGYQSEDRVIIQQDGVRRSASLYSNHISTFRQDNDLLKRVEVVKGASSVQHGGGAIGGVVAMTTKEAADFVPSGKDMGFATKLYYEHNNYKEGYIAGALAPKDKPYEFLAYAKQGSRGDLKMSRAMGTSNGAPVDTVGNDEDLRVLFLQGGVKITPEQKLSLSYYDYKLDNETTWQTLWHPLYSTVTGPVKGNLKQQDAIAKYTYSSLSNPLINISAQVYHSKASYDRGYNYFDTDDQEQVELDYENSDKRSGLRLSNEAHFTTGSVSHRLVTGIDYEKRNEDAEMVTNGQFSDFGSFPNTYKDFGAYGHLESSLFNNALVVQLGGRYDRFDRKVKYKDFQYKDSNFSPRLGASLKVFNGFHVLANYSEAFRAPTPHETSIEGAVNPHYWFLPSGSLKPETVREKELGFSYTNLGLIAPNDVFKTKFMYFDGKIKDMIALGLTREGELGPNGAPYATYQNVSRVKRNGFEWSASYDRKFASIGTSYSRVRQINAATGRYTPRTFADKLNLNFHVRPIEGLSIGANINHWFKPKQNPESTISRGETLWYIRDDFTIVDLNGTWKPMPNSNGVFGRDFEVQFGIKNIFDAEYREASNVETSTIVGRGRNAYIGLRTRF